MRIMHIVPLATQVLEVLHELQPLTGKGKYLFPGTRTPDRTISENTINVALRGLGYLKGEMTGHGFRSAIPTLLNEQGWNRDAIERQLAHCESNIPIATSGAMGILAAEQQYLHAMAY